MYRHTNENIKHMGIFCVCVCSETITEESEVEPDMSPNKEVKDGKLCCCEIPVQFSEMKISQAMLTSLFTNVIFKYYSSNVNNA